MPKIELAQAHLLVGPGLARVLTDYELARRDRVLEPPFCTQMRRMHLERAEMARIDRERAADEGGGLAQALVATLAVIAVQHLEDVGRRDPGERVDVVGIELEGALKLRAGGDHRLARGRAVGDRLPAHDEVHGTRIARPLALAAPRLAVDDLQP